MLRNHFGWASRVALALALLGVFPALTAFGAVYLAPSSVTLSGTVYVDSAGQHVKLPGEWGVSGVTIELISSSGTKTTTTNSSGGYSFSNLSPGTFYTLEEIQPVGFVPSTNATNLGTFLSSTGGNLAAPTSPKGTSSVGVVANSNEIDSIYMPPLTTPGFGASSSGGQYVLHNVNFGEIGKATYTGPGKVPTHPGVPGSGTITTGGTAGMSVSLAVVGNTNRFLLGSSLPVSGSVNNTAVSAASTLTWQITNQSAGVSVTPTSASAIAAGHGTALHGTINSLSLPQPLGTQTASITVHGNGTPANITAPLTIDPVTSRTIDSVTSPNYDETIPAVSFNRAMVNQTYSAPVTFNSAAPRNTTTDLTLNSGNFGATIANGTASLGNDTATTLNGTTTQANATLSITPTVTGPTTSFANFGTTPFKGEALAAGTPTLPTASVPYAVIALEPRTYTTTSGDASTPINLTNPEGTGGYLLGAVVPVSAGLNVVSTNANPDGNHATWVIVGTSGPNGDAAFSNSDGTTNVGNVYTTSTVINGANNNAPTAIPLAIGMAQYGAINASVSIGVASAEASYVNDTTSYPTVNAQYHVDNVGLAATGGTDPANGNNQLFGAPLIATFPAGIAIAPTTAVPAPGSALTSVVAGSGTNGSSSTVANSPGVTAISGTNFRSTIGTSADIVQTGVLATASTISMSWRNRNNDENGNLAGDGNTTLPAGVQWLLSDVVKIQGVPAKTAFAVQLSYDPGLNQLNEPGSPAATVDGTYLMELDGNQWIKASDQVITDPANSIGTNPFPAQSMGLNEFLLAEEGAGFTLDQLVGSWGVDLASNESWAILNQGDVTLAVAPEPGTFVLLIAGGIALFAWGRMRRPLVTKAP